MRSQRGATLVELLVAMAVTSAILVGLAAVSGVAQTVIARWMQPTLNAQSANRLGSWLDQDTRRYAPCHSGTGFDTLTFCDEGGSAVVTYTWESPNLVRKMGHTSTILERDTPPATFSVVCTPGNVTTGTVSVSAGDKTLAAVTFRAPRGSC
jgi:type II secretory pathway component PulJ